MPDWLYPIIFVGALVLLGVVEYAVEQTKQHWTDKEKR